MPEEHLSIGGWEPVDDQERCGIRNGRRSGRNHFWIDVPPTTYRQGFIEPVQEVE